MDVIPVIDLKGGTVVRARRGERRSYAPIVTPLAPTSDPVDVTRGLLGIYPFTTLYVADLDAIERRGGHRDVLFRLRAEFPHLRLWVDNGIADRASARDWLEEGLGQLVIGSETQADSGLMREFAADERIALSLDFRGDAFQGPPELLEDRRCWPRRVIVMTLARVGSGAGPDVERLRTIRDGSAARQVYAAGGVRNADDLRALAEAQACGALVASCLHDGTLTGDEIAAL